MSYIYCGIYKFIPKIANIRDSCKKIKISMYCLSPVSRETHSCLVSRINQFFFSKFNKFLWPQNAAHLSLFSRKNVKIKFIAVQDVPKFILQWYFVSIWKWPQNLIFDISYINYRFLSISNEYFKIWNWCLIDFSLLPPFALTWVTLTLKRKCFI